MKISTKQKQTVVVMGLGFVGLPLLLAIARSRKYKAIGFDIDAARIAQLQKGRTTLRDVHSEDLRKAKAIFTTDPVESLGTADVLVVCVPTPITKNHHPHYAFLDSAIKTIGKYAKRGVLISLESSVAPGTAEQRIMPLLAKAGWSAGVDYELCHCPERISPGDSKWHIGNIPRVIGGSSAKAVKLGTTFYKSILPVSIRPMNSLTEAEMVKMVENTFRDLNIAFVNELSEYAEKMGIDLPNVIQGAATKPFGFLPHFPGCGVGGDCIATDPYYLLMSARTQGVSLSLVKAARQRNEAMPRRLVTRCLAEIPASQRRKQKFLVLGVAYKPDVNDVRRSPGSAVIEELHTLKLQVKAFDPLVKQSSDFSSLPEALEWSTVVLITTAHQQFMASMLRQLKKQPQIVLVADGRNCLDGIAIEKIGKKYIGIGR